MEEFLDTFRYRLLQVCRILKNRGNGSIKIGTYLLDSFELSDGKLTWNVIITKVHLVEEGVDIDEVVIGFKYQKGRPVSVETVDPSMITGKVPKERPEPFAKKIQERIRELFQAVLDSSEEMP